MYQIPENPFKYAAAIKAAEEYRKKVRDITEKNKKIIEKAGIGIPKEIKELEVINMGGDQAHVYGKIREGFFRVVDYRFHYVYDLTNKKALEEESFNANNIGLVDIIGGIIFCLPMGLVTLINQIKPLNRERRKKTVRWEKEVSEAKDNIVSRFCL